VNSLVAAVVVEVLIGLSSLVENAQGIRRERRRRRR